MDLDDQLAALAAGELDDATARSVRARAAADPGLARRLARHEHLQQLLTSWDVPELSDEAVERLDARLDEALAALDDGPLTEAPAPTVAPAPRPTTDEPTPPTSPPSPVSDLRAARERRNSGGAIAWPSWAPAAAVAAALAAVVGTGIVVGGLPGGVGPDTMAQDDSAEEATEDAGETELSEEAAADDSAAGADEAAELSTGRSADVDLAEGELLALVEGGPTDGEADATQDAAVEEDSSGTDGDTTTQDAPASSTGSSAEEVCLVEALERDTPPADGWEVHLLASGTYDGQDAAFVVLRTGDQFEVLAYDPATCDLLARDATAG